MDNRQICYCNNVSESELLQVIYTHHPDLRTLCALTHAGTSCGTCIPRIQCLLAARQGKEDEQTEKGKKDNKIVTSSIGKASFTIDAQDGHYIPATAGMSIRATGENRWILCIEDTLDPAANKTTPLCTVATRQEALQLVGRLALYVRRYARPGENIYAFARRIGITRLRQILHIEEHEFI